MTQSETTDLEGKRGRVSVRTWKNDSPEFITVIAHGIAEHSNRYAHVAQALVDAGSVVYAPDHWGHGLSAGEQGVVDDVDSMAADLGQVIANARAEHPGLKVGLVAHSLGGIVATRLLQLHPAVVDSLVLSGPVVGGNAAILGLLELDPLPDVPIDPSLLSRDDKVGEAYLADPLVYSGPLRRESMVAIRDSVAAISKGGSLGDVPTLWLHGEADGLAPYAETAPVFEHLRGSNFESKVYPEARHEIFNETNQSEVIGDAVAFLRRTLGSGTE